MDILHKIYHYIYQWQTLIAGILALLAGILTILSANRQVSATKEQTEVIIFSERRRIARESHAFFCMVNATMDIVIEDVESVKLIFKDKPKNIGNSHVNYQARQRIKKTAFPDILSNCIHLGGQLTSKFIRLINEIDDFSSQWFSKQTAGEPLQIGKSEGFFEQLEKIEAQAKDLCQESNEGMKKCLEELESIPNFRALSENFNIMRKPPHREG